jgi:DnaJ-class molecular chaperone
MATADASAATLQSLSKTAGVDLNALREKYRGVAVAEQEKHKSTTVPSTEIKAEDMARLDNYHICKSCLGKGTVKTVYNHMVLERDCEECDGESIIDKRALEVMRQLS